MASKARWIALTWSIGVSCVVASSIQAVPALVIPPLASIPPVLATLLVPGNEQVPRVLSGIQAVILLGFVVLALLSVGWFYVPSLVAAAVAAAAEPAERFRSHPSETKS